MALDFSLFQPRIFEFFQDGCSDAAGEPVSATEFFRGAMGAAFLEIADKHDCSVFLSATRVEESRAHWVRDLPRIDIEGSRVPDHFKHAGFLTYWLRRRVVVESVARIGSAATPVQDHFVKFANEICAFVIGFRLSLYFHYHRRLDSSDDASKFFRDIKWDGDLQRDVVTLLRHKEVSPHAIYLILAALFSEVGRHWRQDNVTRLVRAVK